MLKIVKHIAQNLMELHVEAAFTHNQNLRLLTVNEPWPSSTPAPKLFLGRTIEGLNVSRFRHDISDTCIEQLTELFMDESFENDLQAKPKHFDTYMNVLSSEKFSMGPCYLVTEKTTLSPEMAPNIVRITRQNVSELTRNGFHWLIEEIDYVQPILAIVIEGQAVSICRSVRITAKAHEAGLETLGSYRGRGYASQVVAVWATAVRETGSIPLYSTSYENLSSQSVARKCNLALYGTNFTIY